MPTKTTLWLVLNVTPIGSDSFCIATFFRTLKGYFIVNCFGVANCYPNI